MWSKGKIIDDVVVIGIEEGGICKLKGHADSAFTTCTIIPCELWHRRISHVNYKAVLVVIKLVTGLPKIQINHEGVCKGCAQGNNIENPFPSSNRKAKGILDILHSYVCRPMSVTSLSGYVYYVSFIDDYSRNTWIYFFKGKYEVF